MDVDPRNGGDDSLAELIRQHGPFPDTVEVVTGGGGSHLYFRYDAAAFQHLRSRTIAAGVEIKADGRQVVAPPSDHYSGGRYCWEASSYPDDVAIAEAPAWLLNLTVGGRKRVPVEGRAASRVTVPRAPDVLARMLEGVREGQRHETLLWGLGSLRGRGTPEDVAADLAHYAASKFHPPFPPDETADLVRDLFHRYPTNAERQRRRGPSPERLDIWTVVRAAGRPMQPAEVALRLGLPRKNVGVLMHNMAHDGQLARVQDGYIAAVID